MKIVLPENFTVFFKNLNHKFLVKILEVHQKSTVISINGKSIDIPFVLNKNLKYSAKYENNELKIYEEIKKDSPIKEAEDKEIIKKIFKNLDSLLELSDKKENLNENQIKNFPLFEIFSKIINNKKQKNKSNYILKKDDTNSYFFIFNIPFYSKQARIFIKIFKLRDVFLNIYVDDKKGIVFENFYNELKKYLKGKMKNIVVNISDKKDDFYNNILLHIKKNNIDIKI